MKLSIFTLAALVASVFASTPTTCAHDNCYRALFPTLPGSSVYFSSASAYCTSYSSATNKAPITNYPTRATSACGTVQTRYASACACLDTASCEAADSRSGTAIRNGDFECGIAPWSVNTTGDGTWTVSDPAFSGKYAFSFTTTKNIAQLYPPYVDQTITVFAGRQYQITFYTWYSDEYAGFIGLRLNLGDDGTWSFPPDNPQTWEQKSATFTPKTSSLNIRFEFVSNPGSFTFKVDDVVLLLP